MNQFSAPIGTIARIGHWNNKRRIVKVPGGWRTMSGTISQHVDPEDFRAGWDVEHFDWVFCEDELPPEGRVVETRSEHGLIQSLKRQGPLWFTPEGTMYVYYTPIAWKDIEDQP